MGAVEDVKPLSFFKQKSDTVLNYIKSTKKPKFITVNGNVEFVVQDAQSYQDMVDDTSSASDLVKIMQGIDDVEKGRYIAAEEFFDKIGREYNFDL